MAQDKRAAPAPVKKSRKSILGSALHLIVFSVLVSLLAWLFLILGFCGYQISKGQIAVNTWMEAIIKNNREVLKDKKNFIQEKVQTEGKNLLSHVLVEMRATNRWQWIKQKAHRMNREVKQRFPRVQSTWVRVWNTIVKPIIAVFYGVTIIILTRWLIFLCVLPLLMVFIVFGVVDGLVQRDIRKFQGARESAYFFHRIKRMWKPCFFVPLFGYFIWPGVIDPFWFFIPMALCLSVMMQLSLQVFKKYL